MQLRLAALVRRPSPPTIVPQRRNPRRFMVQSYLASHETRKLQQTVLQVVEAVNRQDLEALMSRFSPDCVYSDRVWNSSDVIGSRKVSKVYRELWSAYPDYTMHVEDVLARDDSNTVAVHFTCTGTNFGEWRDHPASGRRTTMSGITLFVFDSERDDQIRQLITYRQPSAEEYSFFLGHEEL